MTPPIICLEGPSAAGKTTLAAALAAAHGAPVVPELDATSAPPPSASAPWFVERHAERWRRARDALAAARPAAPFAVIDCDPFKGLWYNWMHAKEGWQGVGVVAPLYRELVEGGELALPDLYVYLDASEAQLRDRRAGDATRSRRGFEKHVRTLRPQRRYFAALAEAAPGRVAFLATANRAALPGRVAAALRRLPAARPDSLAVLERMAAWVAAHSPDE